MLLTCCGKVMRGLCYVLLLQTALLLQFTEALYEGDACSMKSVSGVCTLTSKCTTLEALIQRREFSVSDIVSCGFDLHEEIICCPTTGQTGTNPTMPTQTTVVFKASTVAPNRDFWEDLLTTSTTTTTTTTAKPDFWLHLLTTTTTSTTPKPLMVGGTELNTNSEFFDFSKLLNSKNKPNANINDGRNIVNNNVHTSATNEWAQTPQQGRQVPRGNSLNSALGNGVQENQFGNRPFSNLNIRPEPAVPLNPPQNNRGNGFGRGRGNMGMPNGSPSQRGVNQPRTNTWQNEFPNARQFEPPQNNGIAWPGQRGNGGRRGNMGTFPAANGNNQRDLQWVPNNDPEMINPPSRHIWPNQQLMSPNAAAESNTPFSSGAAPQLWPNEPRRNAFGRPFDAPETASEIDPIAAVNEHVINAGIDMVTAQLTHFERDWQQQQQNFVPTKDPFAPFEFRPQPEFASNDIDTDGFHAVNGGSSNSGVPPDGFLMDRRPTPPTPTVSPTPPVKNRLDERPAVRACRLLDEGLAPALSPHILDGTPVDLGEYPHMVAIGYSAIGNNAGPYDFRCGGSLIDKKFVLTAAHCVTSRESQPSIVRMGVTNFTDEEQMRNVVEIKIEKIHIHPEYANSRKYNDIAILQLERAVEYSDNVYATCLYTELTDPPLESSLYVTGWGTINITNRRFSNQLLKAKLQITSVASCNQTYADIDGHNRQLNRGVDNTQLCAFDPAITKDACQGDSGGPLNLVLDESTKKYRVVGIISAGFSCGSEVPGLYTRVASFLDYIEGVVWPSSK